MTIHFLFQLGGAGLLAVGIWVSVDGNSFLKVLGPFANQATQFVNVGYFCIVIGAVLVILGFLGCCGAMKESKCLLILVGSSCHCSSAHSGVGWGGEVTMYGQWLGGLIQVPVPGALAHVQCSTPRPNRSHFPHWCKLFSIIFNNPLESQRFRAPGNVTLTRGMYARLTHRVNSNQGWDGF